ncbi:MAG: hypothetical protein WD595_02240 [Waddliaceae bacterium]
MSVSISNSNAISVNKSLSEDSVEWANKNLNVLTQELQEWQTLQWDENSKSLSVYRPGYWYKVNNAFNPDHLNAFFENIGSIIRQSCAVSSHSAYKKSIMDDVKLIQGKVYTALNALDGVIEAYKYYQYNEIAKKIEQVQKVWKEAFVSAKGQTNPEFISQLDGCLAPKPANVKKPVMLQLKQQFPNGATSRKLKKVSVEQSVLSQIKAGQLPKLKSVNDRQIAPKPEGPGCELEEFLNRIRSNMRLNFSHHEASDSEELEFQV